MASLEGGVLLPFQEPLVRRDRGQRQVIDPPVQVGWLETGFAV